VFEHLDIHDVTRIGPAIGVSRTHSPQLQRFMEPCHDLTIRDTRIENVFGEAIYLSGFYPAELQDPAARSRLRNEHSQFLIERVTIRNPGLGGGQGDGIDCKLGLTELTIRDCDIAGVSGMAGIILPTTWLDVDQQLLIERCRFGPSAAGTESRRAIYGGVGDLLTLRGVTVRNCLVDGTRQGIGIYRSGKTASVRDVTVVNNTIRDVPALGLLVDAVDAVVRNNLLFGNDSGRRQADLSGQNLDSDYNAYHGGWGCRTEGAHSVSLSDESVAILREELNQGAFTLPSLAPVTIGGWRSPASATISLAVRGRRERAGTSAVTSTSRPPPAPWNPAARGERVVRLTPLAASARPAPAHLELALILAQEAEQPEVVDP